MLWCSTEAGYSSEHDLLSITVLLLATFFCWVEYTYFCWVEHTQINSLPLPSKTQKLQKRCRGDKDCDDSSKQLSREKLSSTTEKYEQQLTGEKGANGKLRQRINDLLAELEKSRQRENSARECKIDEVAEQLGTKSREMCEKCLILKRRMQGLIEEQLEDRIKPYLDYVSEVQSLAAVLEMKNETIKQFQTQVASHSLMRDEIFTLNHKCEQLRQNNEDLTKRLHDKTEANNNLLAECQALRRSYNEEKSRSAKLLQHNEELTYRLDSLGSHSTSFNPIFTSSPATD